MGSKVNEYRELDSAEEEYDQMKTVAQAGSSRFERYLPYTVPWKVEESFAIKRIQKELIDLGKEKSNSSWQAGPVDESNIFRWKATIKGPQNTPYDGGIFKFDIHFPGNYPQKAPIVTLRTKIHHVNMKQHQAPKLDILKEEWSQEMNISNIMTAIISLMVNPNAEPPK